MSNSGTSSQTQTLPACLRSTSTSCSRIGAPRGLGAAVLLAELLASSLLAAVVIGSGIAAQTLSPNDVGLELFENAAATAAGLYTIILMFGPASGGHFNPVVSLADASFGGIPSGACSRTHSP